MNDKIILDDEIIDLIKPAISSYLENKLIGLLEEDDIKKLADDVIYLIKKVSAEASKGYYKNYQGDIKMNETKKENKSLYMLSDRTLVRFFKKRILILSVSEEKIEKVYLSYDEVWKLFEIVGSLNESGWSEPR